MLPQPSSFRPPASPPPPSSPSSPPPNRDCITQSLNLKADTVIWLLIIKSADCLHSSERNAPKITLFHGAAEVCRFSYFAVFFSTANLKPSSSLSQQTKKNKAILNQKQLDSWHAECKIFKSKTGTEGYKREREVSHYLT